MPVPATGGCESMIPGVQVPSFRLIGDDAFPFNYCEDLIGGMDMRPGAGSIIEEDGDDFEFLALLFGDQVMHVNRSLEVFRVRGSSDGSVWL